MSAPSQNAFDLGMHLLQCAYKTRHEGIVHRSDGHCNPETFYDASFAPDPTDGKSQFGYVCHYFGGPISWLSKKLAHVGTHVGANETMAQCFAAKHATWVKHLLEEITERDQPVVKVYGDNDQATRLAQENMLTMANKYYQTQYYWTKEAQNVSIDSDRVETADNPRDILTKAPDKPTCDRLHPRLSGHVGPHRELPLFDL